MRDWFFIALFLSSFAFALISIIFWSLKNGISPMPTSKQAKQCLLAMLPEKLEGTIYELGSGWGSLLFPLAKRYPKCRIIGYETSLLPYLFSKIRCWWISCPNVRIIRQDFFHTPLDDAALIVCYLYPGAMNLLKNKCSRELQAGTWIVSNTFAISGWAAVKISEVKDLYHTKIYLYLH